LRGAGGRVSWNFGPRTAPSGQGLRSIFHRDLLFQFGNLCLQQLFYPVIRIYDLAMPFARDAVAHQIEELALAEAHSRVCRMQSNV